jgi:hypothetical protein
MKTILFFFLVLSTSLVFSGTLECQLTDHNQVVLTQTVEIKNNQAEIELGPYDRFNSITGFFETNDSYHILWVYALSPEKTKTSNLGSLEVELQLEGKTANPILVYCKANYDSK